MIIPNYKIWEVYDVKQTKTDETLWRFCIKLRTGLGVVYMRGWLYDSIKEKIYPPSYPTGGWRKHYIKLPRDARVAVTREVRKYVEQFYARIEDSKV